MSKRRKEVKVIVVDTEAMQKDRDKPSCFGEKCSYCRSDFCGREWYDQCSSD